MNTAHAHDYPHNTPGSRQDVDSEPKGRQSTQLDFSIEHRRLIRKLELEQAVPLFGRGRRVLEIGAGAGWQAGMLARKGYQVTAIDVPESNYTAIREWNVIRYDGVHIPAPDRYFDVIFSSNVLEHVSDLPGLQQEMFRVLRPGGTAVHIMPTPTWRFWTACNFYVRRMMQAYSMLRRTKIAPVEEEHESWSQLAPSSRFRRALFPPKHGVRGSWLSELYLFSEFRWKKLLVNDQWHLLSITPNGLLYSGYRIFGEKLSIESRRRLSTLLGSSCNLYVLKRSLVSKIDCGVDDRDQ